MPQAIDIEALRDLRSVQESMVRYYGKSEEMQAQNAALIAGGLPPLHSEASFKWDHEQRARHRRFVQVLDAVLAHFGDDQAEAA
jgi:hypothetical protein